MYNTKNIDVEHVTQENIKFKTTVLKSSLCDYSDACILLEGTITAVGE